MSSSYSYSDEELIFYYCAQCKFFSNSQKCIFGNHIINQENELNEFNSINLKNYQIVEEKLIFKKRFQIYCNLFRLESLISEYNNITLKCSQETIKDFFSKFCQVNKNNPEISSKILNIKNNYEAYRYKFISQKNKNNFPTYLFSEFTKRNN